VLLNGIRCRIQGENAHLKGAKVNGFLRGRSIKYAVALLAAGALCAGVLAGCGSGNKTPVSLIKVSAGKDFTISLQSNQTAGYKWQLSEPLKEKVVKKVSSVYKPGTSGAAGAGGVENWTFAAVGKGGADIKMEYVSPSAKGVLSKVRVFKVTVQ
jgi:predicted secreted protein